MRKMFIKESESESKSGKDTKLRNSFILVRFFYAVQDIERNIHNDFDFC